MIVAAYCRVSTDSVDQSNSYENQQSYFQREIVEKGHNLYKIYADQGLTGTKLNNRPEFKQMLIDSGIDIKVIRTSATDKRNRTKHTVYEYSDRDPLFNEIWIKNTSRFARNTLSYEIINLLRRKEVNVFFIEQNINTNDMSQDLLLKLMQIFDEQDSKDKSLKVRTGIAESARKGVVRTNGKLYGYRYIQYENRLEIIPEEAEIIRTIFKLYANGKGIRQIINYLNANKLYTRSNKQFCKSTVRRIIDNEKYAGLNNPLKFDTGIIMQKNVYAKVREHYETVESDKIPSIINRELFYECQEIINSKVNSQNQKGIYKGISKYCGLIYCGNCGNLYYSNQDRGHVFYNCSNKKNNGIVACNNPNIKEVGIDSYIIELTKGSLLETILKEKERATNVFFNVIKLKLDQIDNDKTDEAKFIQKQIEETKEILTGYYDLYAREKSNKDIIQKLMDDMEDKLDKLCIKYQDVIKTNEQLIEEIIKLWDSYSYIIKLDNNKKDYSFDETLQMIDRIVIFKTDTGYRIESPILKAQEIENLLIKYKKDTEFKLLSQDDYDEIISQIKTYINFC